MKQKIIRQGDVLLIPVSLDTPDKTDKHKELTVAWGEVTGHHHTCYSSDKENKSFIESWIDVNGTHFAKFTAEYIMRHQEHGDVYISPGVYQIGNESEYDPFTKKMRRVID